MLISLGDVPRLNAFPFTSIQRGFFPKDEVVLLSDTETLEASQSPEQDVIFLCDSETSQDEGSEVRDFLTQ